MIVNKKVDYMAGPTIKIFEKTQIEDSLALFLKKLLILKTLRQNW
jgi:hypothetical protein